MKKSSNPLGWPGRITLILGAVAVAALLLFAVTSKANAHPFNAPHIGDCGEGFSYDPAGQKENGQVYVTARVTCDYKGSGPAVFALQTQQPGDEQWLSLHKDAWATIADPDTGIKVLRQASVLVNPGQSFRIEVLAPEGELRNHRFVASYPDDNTDVAALAGGLNDDSFVSYVPQGAYEALKRVR